MAEFIPTNLLQQCLSESPRDQKSIAIALIGYINADCYFKTNNFDEGIRYVLSHGMTEEELFCTHNPDMGEIETDSSKWDMDYYALALVYLIDNFSKERIKHVKAIARKLDPNPMPQTTMQKPQESAQRPQNNTVKTQAHANGGDDPSKKALCQCRFKTTRNNADGKKSRIPLISIVILTALAILAIVIITKR